MGTNTLGQESLDSTDISFNELPDPDYNYTIQIDTPQPLHSSPRQGIDPRAVQYDISTPVHELSLLDHHNISPYHLFQFNSDETIHLSQIHSPLSPSTVYEQGIPSSKGFSSIFPCLEPPVSLSNSSLNNVFGNPREGHMDRAPVSTAPTFLELHGNQYSPSPAQRNLGLNSGRGRGKKGHHDARGTFKPGQVEKAPDHLATDKGSQSVLSNSGEPVIVKRKRGRPRKHPLPENTITPTQLPAVTTSKPARGINTPKTPKNMIQFSPTPMRKRSGGCWTCKCRRKKCDEAKPVCTTCEKLQFPCLGYSNERPSCLSTPEKNEQTRQILTSYTKERREFKSRSRLDTDGNTMSPFCIPSINHVLSAINNENDPNS